MVLLASGQRSELVTTSVWLYGVAGSLVTLQNTTKYKYKYKYQTDSQLTHCSGRNADYYQKIIDVQRAGQCCGFGPPLRCTPFISCDGTEETGESCSTNDNSYSDYFLLETATNDAGWGKYKEKRQMCVPGREHTQVGVADGYKR